MAADFHAPTWVERWKDSESQLSVILQLIDETAYLTTNEFIQLAGEFFLSRTAIKYLGSAIFELINGAIGLSKRPNHQSSDPSTRYACEIKLVDNGQTKSFMIPYETALLAICRFAHELTINHRPISVRDTVPYSELELYREFMKQFDILKQEGPSREIRSLCSCIYALNLATYPFLSHNYQHGQFVSHYVCCGNHSQDAAQDRAFASLEGKAARYDDAQYSLMRRKEFPGRPVDPIVTQPNGVLMNSRHPVDARAAPVESRVAPAHDWQAQSRISNERQPDNRPSNDRQQDVHMRDRQNWHGERQPDRHDRPSESQRDADRSYSHERSQSRSGDSRSGERAYDHRAPDYNSHGYDRDRAYDSRNSERSQRDRGDQWADSRPNDGRSSSHDARPNDRRSSSHDTRPIRPVDRYDASGYPDRSRERDRERSRESDQRDRDHNREPERDRPAYYEDRQRDRSNSRSSYNNTNNQASNQPADRSDPPRLDPSPRASSMSKPKQPCYFSIFGECYKPGDMCTFSHGSYKSLLGEFHTGHPTASQTKTEKNDVQFVPLRGAIKNDRYFEEEMLIPIPAKQITLVNFRSTEMRDLIQDVLGGNAGSYTIRGTELRDKPRGLQERWARIVAMGNSKALDRLVEVVCYVMDKDFGHIKPEERITLVNQARKYFDL